MRIEPIENKFRKPISKPISFGVFKQRIATSYGYKDIGEYKGKTITIHHDITDNTKMFYVADNLKNWIKSKLVYLQNGVKKIIISKNKCLIG